MKILIAEDDQVSRKLLVKFLKKWGHEVLPSTNGRECYEMQKKNDVQLLIVDWMMPIMDGIELVKKIRAEKQKGYIYIILLTAKSEPSDIIQGLSSGADDYLTKPFFPQEVEMRIKVGERIIALENELKNNIKSLEESLAKIQKLEGLLPICMYCKNVRDEKDYWHKVDEYIATHTATKFSHGICPKCYKEKFGGDEKD